MTFELVEEAKGGKVVVPETLGERIVRRLNDAFKADPEAVRALLLPVVPINAAAQKGCIGTNDNPEQASLFGIAFGGWENDETVVFVTEAAGHESREDTITKLTGFALHKKGQL